MPRVCTESVLVSQHPTPTKKSNKTLEWMRISFAFLWVRGIEIIFHYPTPNEKTNKKLVDDLASAAPSWAIQEKYSYQEY